MVLHDVLGAASQRMIGVEVLDGFWISSEEPDHSGRSRATRPSAQFPRRRRTGADRHNPELTDEDLRDAWARARKAHIPITEYLRRLTRRRRRKKYES